MVLEGSSRPRARLSRNNLRSGGSTSSNSISHCPSSMERSIACYISACSFNNQWGIFITFICVVGAWTASLWSSKELCWAQFQLSSLVEVVGNGKRADHRKGGKFAEKELIGFQSMSFAIFGGVLAGLCRVIARRVSLKTQIKRRLHVVTVMAAACFLFPVAVFEATQKTGEAKVQTNTMPIWTFICNTLFGIIVPFYVDTITEERLHIFVASPKHLMVTSGCISVLEIFYGMNFSFLGFLICVSLLGLGIFEATPLERSQRESAQLPMQVDNFDASPNSLTMSPIVDGRQSAMIERVTTSLA